MKGDLKLTSEQKIAIQETVEEMSCDVKNDFNTVMTQIKNMDDRKEINKLVDPVCSDLFAMTRITSDYGLRLELFEMWLECVDIINQRTTKQ